jgi:CDP-diacylglycerol--glycerol-3-phosphate 3-phosphatidyltransferase
MANKRIV